LDGQTDAKVAEILPELNPCTYRPEVQSSRGTFWSAACRSSRSNVEVSPPPISGRRWDGLDTDIGAGVWCINHLTIADIDSDVGDIAGTATEEHEIAGLELGTGRQRWACLVLVLGHSGKCDPGHFVGRLDEPPVEFAPQSLSLLLAFRPRLPQSE
jgi:hypothetical protein